MEKVYKCECGKEFDHCNKFNGHKSHCSIHMIAVGKDPSCKRNISEDAKARMNWSKGLTKETSDIIRKASEKRPKLYGEDNPITHWNRNQPKESYQRQSETRKRRYAEGSLKPAKGVGRGKYSYLVIKDKRYMLRSTYEFIYALYLYYNNIEFEIEAITLPALRVNNYANTFLSDFSYGNNVVEVKGIKSGKDLYIKETFENAGYNFKILYEKEINDCKEFLKNIVDIESLLYKIQEGHKTKNYFIYNI